MNNEHFSIQYLLSRPAVTPSHNLSFFNWRPRDKQSKN